jgi:hypothetical protein
MAGQIDRESAIFLGVGRALLLQLGHPWVEHLPIRSAGFTNMFAMVFGTLDQSMDAARCLHRRHASITDQLPWTAGPFAVKLEYGANAIPAFGGDRLC